MIQQAPESDRLKAETRKASIPTEDNGAEAQNQPPEDEAQDFGWESNREDGNPENLPWPEENESKE